MRLGFLSTKRAAASRSADGILDRWPTAPQSSGDAACANNAKPLLIKEKDGAGYRTRTYDPRFTNRLGGRVQLSAFRSKIVDSCSY